MTTVPVAIVQGESTSDFGTVLERTAALAETASRDGATFVAFPETWIPCYPAWLDVCRDVALWDHEPAKELFATYAEHSVRVNGHEGAFLSALASKLAITLSVGVSERVSEGRGRGTLYNSLLTFGPDGRLLNHHRKLVPTFSERMVWGPGDADGLRAVDTPAGRVGGLICWEHWMPLARQALHESGEDIHVAAWPTAHERNQIASRQYAFEGRTFVLVACSVMRASALPAALSPDPSRVQRPDQFVVRGGSAVIAPDGNFLVEPVFEQETIVHAVLDLRRTLAESMTLDVTGHYARPDCLQLNVTRTGRLDTHHP